MVFLLDMLRIHFCSRDVSQLSHSHGPTFLKVEDDLHNLVPIQTSKQNPNSLKSYIFSISPATLWGPHLSLSC